MSQSGMEFLNSRLMFGMQPGLESTRKICAALGNPQQKFRTIHVVGTNGKGSTSFYLSGILQSHGLRTGLYTSPHLVSLRERIRVDDVPIDDASLDRLLLTVKDAAERVGVEPTFFEVLTIVAFLFYAEQKIDVVVLEAGMGGRLDSTAVACGDIVVLTSIGLEHTEVLGATESAILKEKMGVVESLDSASAKRTFVVGGLSRELLWEARDYAAAHGCDCIVPEIRSDVELPNLGRHYVENASLSLKACEIFLKNYFVCSKSARSADYDDALAVRLLKSRSWAGRMQKLSDAKGNVQFILDGAHNSHAVRRLVEALCEYFPGQKFHCVFGALKDKDMDEMLRLMAPYVSHWHVTRTPYPRFRELDDMKSLFGSLHLKVDSAGFLSREFLDEVRRVADGPVLVTGSLYMIGETVQALKENFEELAFFRGLELTTNEHR